MTRMPWETDAPPKADKERAALLRSLAVYAEASGEELYNFMIRVHITNGPANESLKNLAPGTIARIRRFLATTPRPVKGESPVDFW